jgi:hypothetical protein
MEIERLLHRIVSLGFGGLLCAAAYLGLVAVAGCGRETAPNLPRTTEARLDEQVSFQTCQLAPSEGDLRPSRCGDPLSGQASSRIRRLARDRVASTRSLAATLVLSVETETLSRELRRLEHQAGNSPTVEQLFALAALEHALARSSGDPIHLVSALEHTEAGLAKQPAALVGVFNRGVIASDLGLCRLAARSWQLYRKQEPESAWAQEAEERLSLLPCTNSGHPDRDLSPDDLFAAAFESHLPRWVKARQKSPRAAKSLLDAISRAGAELEASSGDPVIRELADELKATRDPDHLSAIAAYVEGWQLYEAEDYAGAKPRLELAADHFRRHGSCLAPWTDLLLSGINLYDGRFEAAERRLQGAAGSPETARSARLRGRVLWISGHSELRAGRLQSGYDSVSRAEMEFRQAGYSSAAASVSTLAAEALAHLGFLRQSWHPRVRALRTLQAAKGRFSFFHNALVDGAMAAERAGFHAVAESFLREAVDVAKAQGTRPQESRRC